MKAHHTLLPVLCLTLAGCATLPPSGQCTNVIGRNGSLLKFCQTSGTLTIYESGINPNAAANAVSIVNNPAALKALQSELPLRRGLGSSRRLIANSCSVAGNRYLNISLVDLKRIMGQPSLSN